MVLDQLAVQLAVSAYGAEQALPLTGMEWFLTSTQAHAEVENHLMAPISSNVASRIRSAVLERMMCDGQLLMELVRRQKYQEEESLKTWKLPVQIATPLIAVVILLLSAYAILQRIQYLRMLNRDDWKINFYEIDFVLPKKRRPELNSAAANTGRDVLSSSENCLGRWNNHEVVIRPLSIASVLYVNWKVKQALMRMRDEIGHENVARFFGISSHDAAVYLVEQHCANVTLVDFMRDNKYIVNQSCRYVVCADIANGMGYLHQQNLIHGNLSIDKCYVDSRWAIKITDWEYTALYDVVRRTRNKAHACDKSVLNFLCGEGSQSFRHLAPEIQKDGHLLEPTRAGDVYSFGVIIQDVFVDLPDQETSDGTCNEMPARARQIMNVACQKTAINRPTFQQLEKSMRSAISDGQTNLLDRCVSCVYIGKSFACLLKYRPRRSKTSNHNSRAAVVDPGLSKGKHRSSRHFCICQCVGMQPFSNSSVIKLHDDT